MLLSFLPTFLKAEGHLLPLPKTVPPLSRPPSVPWAPAAPLGTPLAAPPAPSAPPSLPTSPFSGEMRAGRPPHRGLKQHTEQKACYPFLLQVHRVLKEDLPLSSPFLTLYSFLKYSFLCLRCSLLFFYLLVFLACVASSLCITC